MKGELMSKKTIKYYRVQKNLTVAELAKSVGLSERTIYTWESNPDILKRVRTGNLVRVCNALGITIDEVV